MRFPTRPAAVAVAAAAVALGAAASPALAAPTALGGGRHVADEIGVDQALAMLPDTAPVTGLPGAQLVRPLSHQQLDPLAQTGSDPLSNSVGVNVGGLPVGTQLLTGSLAHGASAATLLPLSGRPAR